MKGGQVYLLCKSYAAYAAVRGEIYNQSVP